MSDQPLRQRIAAIARVAIPAVILIALAPPPPPPPPPPPKEQPPEPKDETTPAPSPDPKPEATPKNEAPRQLTINGPAQAGADAFGVAAGKGGGVAVGGDPDGSDTPGGGALAQATYERYLRSRLQAAIQADERINRLFFNAQVRIWVRPDGAVGAVTIAQSSGDDRADRALVAALQALPRLDPPPPQLKFPARVALRGRRA
jgi:TonB family protein